MDKDKLLAQITADPRLPTPPSIALQVLERASRPQCTIGEISKIISHDPALCSKILRMVNSTMFGLPRAVTSIERAMSLLGLTRVRSIVLSLSLPAMQTRHTANPRMRDFWKSSVATAIVARELAAHLGTPDPDSEMVSGLLCDIGVLVLQEVYPDQYLEVLAYPPEVLVANQCAIEEKVLGLHHAEVSAYILKRWRLPEEITQPILFHHHLEKAPDAFLRRTQLMYFASRVAQLQLTVGQSTILGEIVSLALQRFNMDDQQLRDFLDPITTRIEEFAGLLHVEIGACQQYSTLFASATENLTRLAVETSIDNFRAHEETNQAKRDLKKVEQALQSTEEKLRQAVKLEAIGRLAGGVAHDFNNLLTVINGYSELLLGTMTPDDPHRHFVKDIAEAGQRAAELTRQLLAFSRKQLLVPEVLSLNDVIVGVDKLLRRLIREDIHLHISLEPQLHLVKVDRNQMDQVIMNLTVNARDAMPQGGTLSIVTKNVELDESCVPPHEDVKPGSFVLLAVTDSGIGMNHETKSHLFEPFFTTKDGKGTGLGLATVHGIVKQSGGYVAVYSEVGHGAIFKVYLPQASELVGATTAPPVLREVPRGAETVLLTEDDESVRRVARHALEMYGYLVLEAGDGHEALRISEAHSAPIHMLITDTIMPHMGGCELAQRLSRARPDIKVLYTSGYTDDAVIRQGILNSSTPFLQKPFTPQVLANKVYDLLRAGKQIM